MSRDVATLVEDGPDGFRVHAAAFSDPEIFEQEMKQVFARNWIFLTLESEIRNPNDFVACWIGRVPVLVTRDHEGSIRAFINACRHKGAMLCTTDSGNSRYHVCPYHGWAYESSGANADVKDRKTGAYGAGFARDNQDLQPIPRIESYRGLIFGSLSEDVPPLPEFLAGARFYVDLLADMSPQGFEAIPGKTSYTFKGNWKLQMDNGLDFYHLTSTHVSFLEVQARRQAGVGNQEVVQFDWQKRLSQPAGTFEFRNGHSATWLQQAEGSKRPIYPVMDEVRRRIGDERADWIIGMMRNMTIFPNLQLADSTSPLLRTFRPISVDKTEMRVYCLAPVGESRELRSWRLRQYEDFFNPSGLATPDDTTLFEDCQRAFTSGQVTWLQGYQRGIGVRTEGQDEIAAGSGVDTVGCVKGTFGMQNEVCFHPPWREWVRMMTR